MSNALLRLQGVIDSLLGPDGCPWDKKQTPKSLCDYVLEEAHELAEAIQADDTAEAREEMGDLVFLILFIARLYEKQGAFTLDQAMEASAAKMIRRHPHVFDSLEIETQEELLRNWERIKREEKGDSGGAPKRTFGSLPKGLPPLLKAYRIHSKAARTGFTWENDRDALAQLQAEWREWEEAAGTGDKDLMEQEYGDFLFTLVELGRRQGFKANTALNRANLKFLARFERMEDLAREQGSDLADMDLAAMNALWKKAKEEAGEE